MMLKEADNHSIPRQDLKYRHSTAMGEISGWGGGYEEVCQVMLDAGVKWLDEHPGVELLFHSYENVIGIIIEDNDNAKALTKCIIDASNTVPGGGATGAMHHAVINRLRWIRSHSWAEYVKELEQRELEPEEKVDA